MSVLKYEFTIEEVVGEKKITLDDVEQLRIWNSTVDLPTIPPELLAIFIIACERDLEKSKKAILAYSTCKKESDLFGDRNIDNADLRLGLNTVYNLIMPVRTDDDCVVYLIKLNDTNYQNFDLDTMAKLFFMTLESCTKTTPTPPTGVKIIADFKGLGFMHITRFKLKTLRRMVHFLQEALPIHMKALHLINFGYIAEKVVFLAKPFIKLQLFEVMHFHPSATDMDIFSEKFIPKKCLPKEYGGFLPSFQELKEETIGRLRQLQKYFEDEEKLWRDGNDKDDKEATIEMSLPKYQFKLSDAIKEEKVSKTEVQRLKKWMPTVNLPNVSNEMIASFIIACERDLESAKKTMLTYFRIKRSTPEFFENRDIGRNDLRNIMNIIQFGSMPVRTDDDCVVHLSRIVDSRYSNFQVDPASKIYLMLNDITLNSGTPPRGVILMTDMKGLGLMHLSRLKLKSLRTLTEFVQGGMPLNVKEIHLMNASYVTEKFIFMLKPFIRPEVFGKINIHRSNINMADFHEKYIPKNVYP
ncbi:hypothetical protein WA026_011080 [Henosepilachna vigintioctopunctata]